MRGDTRWLSLIALTVVACAALASYDGRSRAFSPVAMETDLFRTIARRQNPVVVAVLTTAHESPSPQDLDLFKRFFSRSLSEEPRVRHDAGSGFLINRDGDILTSDHLVVDADVIRVRLFGTVTTTHRATLVGRDPITDTALLRLQRPAGDLPFATLGDSDQLEGGDWVVAIGNPFQFELEVQELLSTVPARAELAVEETLNFGLSLRDGADGSVVQDVENESPAAQAGVEEGDIFRKVNRQPVHTAAEAMRELQRTPPGRPTFVLVWRAGRELLLEMQRD